MRVADRRQVAAAARATGVLTLLERLPHRRGLVVLNYHRVGSVADNPFDDSTFSADVETFRKQLACLQRRFDLPALPAVLDAVERRRFDAPTAVVTFDDGYKDNYELALPVLRELGVPAVFFIVSDYLDRPLLPWWDRVAFIVKRTRRETLELGYPEPLRFDMRTARRDRVTWRVLRACKDARPFDRALFFDELEARAEVAADPVALGRQLFMSPDHVRGLSQSGMAIGSHTASHPVLAALSEDEQRVELRRSRERLAEVVGTPPDTLAYPVGGPTAFTAATKRLAREAGYRAAFCFFGGLNRQDALDPYALCRVGVSREETFAQFRLRLALAR
jgi:peptidoglycan/xylan/chitin deacetylase (PgdA/CDA1 family)